VHRVVRASPTKANGGRHTSFVHVAVFPASHDSSGGSDGGNSSALSLSDVRIDTFRSSGAGGQHVNVTASAVRAVHVPTGVVATCQAERSQHRNRAGALALLQAKLDQRAADAEAVDARARQSFLFSVASPTRELRRCHSAAELTGASCVEPRAAVHLICHFFPPFCSHQAARAAARGQQVPVSFGAQARSYVLSPYHLVKDHRAFIAAGLAAGGGSATLGGVDQETGAAAAAAGSEAAEEAAVEGHAALAVLEGHLEPLLAPLLRAKAEADASLLA